MEPRPYCKAQEAGLGWHLANLIHASPNDDIQHGLGGLGRGSGGGQPLVLNIPSTDHPRHICHPVRHGGVLESCFLKFKLLCDNIEQVRCFRAQAVWESVWDFWGHCPFAAKGLAGLQDTLQLRRQKSLNLKLPSHPPSHPPQDALNPQTPK